MNARAPFLFIIFTVTLDAIGVGLIMPVMPEFIRELRGSDISDAAFWGGLLSFTYAIMQFLCGPLLGNLSDRYGRRPVLIISLFFMGMNYIAMAVAPSLILIFVARLFSGITGATYSTAAAYLSDISEKGKRSANFGLIGAAFGVGFVLGPAIGGLLGEFGVRMPFLFAGVLALMNALFGLFILPETLSTGNRRAFELKRANPFTAIMRIRNLPLVGSLMFVVLLYAISNNVYPSVWSYFTIERFSWPLSTVGLSLAAYGLSSAIVQIWVLRKVIPKWGEEATATFGMLMAIISLIFLSLVKNGMLLFVSLPIVALGALVGPSLQGMMADRVSDNEQGELQGVYSSVLAIASIVSPLLMTNIFRVFTQEGQTYYMPGAPFAASAALALLALVVLRRSAQERRSD